MKYFVIFGLLTILLVSIWHVQPAESQMMCAGGDETFHFTMSDVVFIGTVNSITSSDSHRLWNYISFDIQYSFKGLTNQSEIVVPTHQGSTYGFEPEIGSMYLIHASNAYGVDLFTNLCSDNKLLETQQDVEAMKNKLLEISTPPPLKQKQFGLAPHAIKCKEDLVLIKKYDDSPACVTIQTKQKLIERGWTESVCNDLILNHLHKYSNLFESGYDGKFGIEDIGLPAGVSEKDLNNCVTKTQETIQRLEYNPHKPLEISPTDAKFIEQLALQDPVVVNFVSEIEWKSECCKDTFVVETQEYEISVIFQRLDKDSHLRVIFDRDTLEIIDITNDSYIRHTPIKPELGKSGTYELEQSGTEFDIKYHITGGSDIKEIIPDNNSNKISIILEPYGSGSLAIILPRELIDAKISKDVDDLFFVLIDGEEVPYHETTNETSRTLTIQIEKDSKTIEIIGIMPL